MSTPTDSNFIFEQQHRGHIWRVQLSEYQGRPNVLFWPWYRNDDGKLMPCNSKYIKSGLQMPPERLWELGEAIAAAKAETELQRR